MKSTVINQPFKLASRSANIDSVYGPYKSVKEALDNVPLEYRAIGRTLAILEDGSLSEYQFKKGVRDEDLELKNSIDSGDIEITWDAIMGKPAVIASGTTQAAARQSIGAGTSNLQIGTTSSTAKAGNYQPTWEQVTGKPTTFAPSAHTHAWGDITDKPSTFAPTIGTTSTTAKAGNYQPTAANISDATDIGRSVLTAATAAAARTAIGAGTGNSNLSLGTTASTAKAGNYTPSATEIVTAIEAMTPEQVTAVQTKLGITPAAE